MTQSNRVGIAQESSTYLTRDYLGSPKSEIPWAAREHSWWIGQWCGVVGGAVASDTRDPWFESTHRQVYLLSTVLKNCIEKAK